MFLSPPAEPPSDSGWRLAGPLALVAAAFGLDVALSGGIAGPILYLPAVLALYRAQTARTFLCVGVGAIALIAVVTVATEHTADDLALGRGLMALTLGLVCFLIHRLSRAAALVRWLTTIDPITGTYNRAYFLELIEREQRRATRYRVDYSILLLGVDQLRDAHAHGVGAQALQTIANICKTMLRPTDFLARYGDEEFIIALTHTHEKGAITTAHRMRDALAAIALPTASGALSFASSIGISCSTENTKLDDILTGADHARILARSSGRNRVCVDHGPDRPAIFA